MAAVLLSSFILDISCHKYFKKKKKSKKMSWRPIKVKLENYVTSPGNKVN